MRIRVLPAVVGYDKDKNLDGAVKAIAGPIRFLSDDAPAGSCLTVDIGYPGLL